MDVKENEEVPLLGRVLRQWHTLTWHHLEVLRTERGKKHRSLRERACPTGPHCLKSQDNRNGLLLQFPSRWTALTARMDGSRDWLVPNITSQELNQTFPVRDLSWKNTGGHSCIF